MIQNQQSNKPLISTCELSPRVEREVRVATAALLLEMAESDNVFVSDEAETLFRLMERAFAVNHSEALNIVQAAKLLRKATYSLEDFTSILLTAVSHEDRKMLLAMLSRIMIADGVVAGAEERLCRKLQHLLHLSDEEERDAFQLAMLASKIGQVINGDVSIQSFQPLIYE